MLSSSLCDYSDGYILCEKNCAPFTSCISRINNTQVDNAQYIDVAIRG